MCKNRFIILLLFIVLVLVGYKIYNNIVSPDMEISYPDTKLRIEVYFIGENPVNNKIKMKKYINKKFVGEIVIDTISKISGFKILDDDNSIIILSGMNEYKF